MRRFRVLKISLNTTYPSATTQRATTRSETFDSATNAETSDQDASKTTVNAYLNARLITVSEITGFPRLRGILQAEVEVLQSHWNEIMYLTRRYSEKEQC